jgi:hypothetical protein
VSAKANSLRALGLALVLLGLSASPAAAAPTPLLGLDLSRDPAPTSTPVTHSDERALYLVTVSNTAASNPVLGDQLTCLGTPADGKSWFGNPTPSFTYQWLRSGQPIVGATERTYTVAGADEGKGLQCVVKGTNDADGAGGTYAPISATTASLPVNVAPVGSPEPPRGTAFDEARIGGGEAVLPVGTATTMAGSSELKEVITTKGSGTLTAGSTTISGVITSVGEFSSGQIVSGTGIAAKTEIREVGAGTLTLSKAATASGVQVLVAGADPFNAGQTISGAGIPAGTKILSATASGEVPTQDQTLIVSNPATASASGVEISATSELTCKAPASWSGSGLAWSFQWLRNGSAIAGETGSIYAVQPADVSPPSLLQCEAIGKDSAGNEVVSISGVRPTGPRPPRPYVSPGPSDLPVVGLPTRTEGPVAVEVLLPAGAETRVLKATGKDWSCTKEAPTVLSRATVSCTRSDSLAPGDSFSAIEIIAQIDHAAPDTLVAKASVSGGGAPSGASDEDSFTVLAAIPFGFSNFSTAVLDELGNDYTQAGGHPFSAGAKLGFTEHVRAVFNAEANGFRATNGSVREILTDLPQGFVGNPQAVAVKCPSIANVLSEPTTCPPGSVVGEISLETQQVIAEDLPIYAMKPEFGAPAQFAFGVQGVHLGFTLTPELRAGDGYAIRLVTAAAPQFPEVFAAEATLCSYGGNIQTVPRSIFLNCKKASEVPPSTIPFITNPPRCSGPAPTTRILADTWAQPGNYAKAEFTAPALSGCDAVKFEPQISLTPSSNEADSPTGLDVDLTMPTEGLEKIGAVAQANLANSTVTLPVGMSVNPSLASGLGACSAAEIGLGSNAEAECPESSRVGSVEVQTPLLDNPLQGTVYVAKQSDNPFGSLLALYLVFVSKRDGINIKVAGKVSPDPVTGQLTTSFEENPQAPISRLSLHLAGGERAPLINPPTCGSYDIAANLSPWSAQDPAHPSAAETVSSISSFEVEAGPRGAACPSKPQALRPKLEAGLTNPVAGATGGLALWLSREDATQRFAGLSVKMPPGLTGYLKGIAQCPDSTLAAIPSAEGTGAAQLASPSCPAASALGSVSAGAGAGPSPFYANTGKIYLAGPYKGAPLSIAIVTPALAGPFDLGNVVVRNALRVNPQTAQITAVSDPIPTILHGLLLDLRDIRVNIDRPNFILAPTNCEPMSIEAQVTGEQGSSAQVSNRFQVGGCEGLKFKPNLKIQLHGGTRRGAYQRLVATVTAKPGEANIAATAVTFPHSAFLAQEHINTVCTRVQFAAHQCPKGSIYGQATATTPLLGEPLTGPVYLRSSDNPLPDLVAALRGPDSTPIEVELAGRTDSKDGGIRNTFDLVPDAPVTKFTLQLRGGKKSLIVNSRNLCNGTQRATVKMTGQNGKTHDFRPLVANDCKKGKKGKKGKSQKTKKSHGKRVS